MQFTKDDITFILAVIGSIGTMFSLISSFLTKRKHLKIKISRTLYRTDLGNLLIALTFENRSQLPIAVTCVKIFSCEKELKLEEYPRYVSHSSYRHSSELVDWKFQYNLCFPVDIPQLGAVSGYLLLDISQRELENLSTPLILEVFSTRGKVQKIKLPPCQTQPPNTQAAEHNLQEK